MASAVVDERGRIGRIYAVECGHLVKVEEAEDDIEDPGLGKPVSPESAPWDPTEV